MQKEGRSQWTPHRLGKLPSLLPALPAGLLRCTHSPEGIRGGPLTEECQETRLTRVRTPSAVPGKVNRVEREHLFMRRVIKWKAVMPSPNQLFIASYLLFNLAPIRKIRLMAVKWLRRAHCPSAEKAPGHCSVSKAKEEKKIGEAHAVSLRANASSPPLLEFLLAQIFALSLAASIRANFPKVRFYELKSQPSCSLSPLPSGNVFDLQYLPSEVLGCLNLHQGQWRL